MVSTRLHAGLTHRHTHTAETTPVTGRYHTPRTITPRDPGERLPRHGAISPVDHIDQISDES
jgi:hypothetical protein